jgi:hypothetical protein
LLGVHRADGIAAKKRKKRKRKRNKKPGEAFVRCDAIPRPRDSSPPGVGRLEGSSISPKPDKVLPTKASFCVLCAFLRLFFFFPGVSVDQTLFSSVETALTLGEGNAEGRDARDWRFEMKRGIFQIPKGVIVAHIIRRRAP